MRSDITPGQTSDYLGFDLVIDDNLQEPSVLMADRGYASDKKVDVLYPRSSFVLTTRVSEAVWFDSLLRHTERGGETENHLSFYGYRHPSQNKRHFLNLYETHNARVREYFRGCPRFTELCWEMGDGWAELCGFLDKPVPDIPFPHANRGVQP